MLVIMAAVFFIETDEKKYFFVIFNIVKSINDNTL